MSCIRKSADPLAIKSSRQPLLIKHKFIPGGRIVLPGDKSIAHRALILSALSRGQTLIKNFPVHDDSLATLKALSALGVKILYKPGLVIVTGCGRQGFKKPGAAVFVNNSGTTLRLLLGVLSGMNFTTKITAAKSLAGRPMSRVNTPLRLMGAQITSRIKNGEEYAPLAITGGSLKGIVYSPMVASAQVKSAILLAGLFAKGKTKVIERLSTRDHTERMLRAFGADITINKNSVTLNSARALASPGNINIPGDISSAAFFIVLALIIPGSKIVIAHSSLNPGRMGLIQVLKRMQAKIKVKAFKQDRFIGVEPSGNITAESCRLKATVIEPTEIPYLVDELPILMVAACFAQGLTEIKGVGELRVKETDRIESMVVNLRKMGAQIKVRKNKGREDILISGQGGLCAANLKSFGDHRTAMSLVVAALAAEGESSLDDISCVNKSFPGFLKVLQALKYRKIAK